jgi:surface protein
MKTIHQYISLSNEKISTIDDYISLSNKKISSIDDYINEKLIISKTHKQKLVVTSERELRDIIYNMNTDDGYLDLTHIDVSQMKRLKEIIIDRTDITEIDVTGWNVSQVCNLDSFVDNCINLHTIHGLETWKTDSLTSINCLFMHCSALQNIDLTGWKLNNVGYCQFAFAECPLLKLDLTDTGLNVEGCQINTAFASKSPFIKYE